MKLKRGIPQGSILGPLLFKAFITDLFMFIENCEISNFADEKTIYSGGIELSTTIQYESDTISWSGLELIY